MRDNSPGDMVGGLECFEEPSAWLFLAGRMKPLSGWGAPLAEAFAKDFDPAC